MKIVIIGNGISGITAARWIRKMSHFDIHVISEESDHFFSRTALMYIYMGHMRYEDTKPYEDWFWKKNRIQLHRSRVVALNVDNKSLDLDDHTVMHFDKLIIATGSKSNKFGWPGQHLKAVSGLYSLQDLETMENYSEGLHRAVIVGGGLVGIEMAEMFHSRNIPVTMLVREKEYWDNVLPKEEASMVSRHIRENHIDLRLNVNLREIVDDGNGRASGVIIKETGEKIDCGFVGLTPGVSPNIDLAKNTPIETHKGILVDPYLRTNIDDIYAIGDCAQIAEPSDGRAPIEAVWYTGRMMGETVAHTICGSSKKYQPGIWFNSAKFIDIEYQIYGKVPNQSTDGYESLYWEHPDGKKSIRIVFRAKDEIVVGFNLMGIRYRHEVCEKWIKKKTPVQQVLSQLSLANFDPEFSRQYESDVIRIYNQKTGQNVQIREKRSLNRVLQFLSR